MIDEQYADKKSQIMFMIHISNDISDDWWFSPGTQVLQSIKTVGCNNIFKATWN